LYEKAKERIRSRAREAKAEVFFEDDHEKAVHEIEDAGILLEYITLETLWNARG